MSFIQYKKEKVLLESIRTSNKNYIVVYPGRFQPFHINHYETYRNLVNEFGVNNVVIATSDKVEPEKSPFNFEEKKKIITTMFDVDEDKVIKIKNPYAPVEILENFDENTVYITAVGEKDADRLTKGKYFSDYDEDNIEDKVGYADGGYVFVTPPNTNYYGDEKISGTLVREVFRSGNEEEQKRLFITLYKKLNKEIFELITDKF
ncbi:MAG: hypothetical protein WC260_01520 [Candidatus Pacearchaeota archaeon]